MLQEDSTVLASCASNSTLAQQEATALASLVYLADTHNASSVVILPPAEYDGLPALASSFAQSFPTLQVRPACPLDIRWKGDEGCSRCSCLPSFHPLCPHLAMQMLARPATRSIRTDSASPAGASCLKCLRLTAFSLLQAATDKGSIAVVQMAEQAVGRNVSLVPTGLAYGTVYNLAVNLASSFKAFQLPAGAATPFLLYEAGYQLPSDVGSYLVGLTVASTMTGWPLL